MPISKVAAALAASLLALSAAGCGKAADQDAAFGAKVRAYLLAHPEVVQEAIEKLQAKQDAETAAQTRIAIEKHRTAIERDPRDFVANPNGKITVTEFYDYRCPHCINVAPKVLDLIRSDSDVRVVFKEFPIFGATSEHAARAAIAVKQAGGDYLAVYKAFMAAHPLDDAAIDRILTESGVSPAGLDDPKAKAAADRQLTDVRNLAVDDLGIQGTPAFIVGDVMVPGEDMDAVKAAIAQARKARAG